ncbi:hypothetical protein ACIF9R_25370, partial [Streptomyces sp. NPDC086080]
RPLGIRLTSYVPARHKIRTLPDQDHTTEATLVFGVSLKAVDTWWAKWQAGGWEALVMRVPPYSPELNPDELVNADLEHSLPKQQRARDQAELAAETRRFFRRNANDNRTSSAAASEARTSATAWTRTP